MRKRDLRAGIDGHAAHAAATARHDDDHDPRADDDSRSSAEADASADGAKAPELLLALMNVGNRRLSRSAVGTTY